VQAHALRHIPGSHSWLLQPPYRGLTAFDSLVGTQESPPLGAVLYVTAPNTLAALANLVVATHRWPWIVPCVGLPPAEEQLEPLLDLVFELRPRLAVFKQREYQPSNIVDKLVAAVHQRPGPRASDLAAYISLRLGIGELREPLTEQFLRALDSGLPSRRSLATYSRLFSRHGNYTARDWRAIARLAHALNRASSCLHLGDPTDLRARLPMRTARWSARKYLALPWRVVKRLLGWEWVLESALRSACYLEVQGS